MVKGTKKRGGDVGVPSQEEGVFSKLTKAVTGAYTKAKEAVVGPVNNGLASTDLPDVATQDAQKVLGTAPEDAGRTMSGGKKYGRTRKSKKSSKKTMRRKH